MSEHQNHSLTDFTEDSQSNNYSSESTKTLETDSPSNDPNGSDECLCPCYEEQHNRDRWREVFGKLRAGELDDRPVTEPRCGHVIHYFCEDTESKIQVSTAEKYISSLRFYVTFIHNQGETVEEAEFKDVDKFFKQRAREDRREGTLRTDMAAITNLYKHIEKNRDGCDPNVNWALIREDISPSDYQTPIEMERGHLNLEEIRALFSAIQYTESSESGDEGETGNKDSDADASVYSFRNKLMVQTGVELGPRNTDICNITVNRVDLENKEIEVKNTKTGGTDIKPITDELALLLRHWIKIERPKFPGANSHDYLFPSQRGGRLETGSLNAIVKEAAEQAGIQEVIAKAPIPESQKKVLGTDKDYREYHAVTVHTLRHTFNFLLKEAGLSLEERSEAMDHADTEVTRESYGVDEEQYKQLMKELFPGLNMIK